MEPIRDQIVFDWVMALGSTQEASKLLGLPQSSVSRRYRALAQQFAIAVKRSKGQLFIAGSAHSYRMLRELSQHFRFERNLYRWSWQPVLLPLLERAGRVGEGSQYLALSNEQWGRRLDHLNERILDACFELCTDPEAHWVGTVNLGLHLRIPTGHHLQAANPERRRSQAREQPIVLGNVELSESLRRQLKADGYQLVDEHPGGLDLCPGPAEGAGSISLPYRLDAGWRLAPLPPFAVVSPTLLEAAVAALDQGVGKNPA